MRGFVFLLILGSSLFLEAKTRPMELSVLTIADGSLETFVTAVADVNRIQRVFSNIATQTGVRFKSTRLIGKKASQGRIRAWISSLHRSRSIAVVYYSGKSLFLPQKRDRLPSIALPKRSGSTVAYSQTQLCKRLARAKVRLGIVMFDCYNHLNTKDRTIPYSDYIEPSQISGERAVGFVPLFLETGGIISISSDRDPNRAMGCFAQWPGPSGGACTTGFLTALYRCVPQPRTTWQTVASATQSVYSEAGLPQRAHFTFKCRQLAHHTPRPKI